VIAHTHSCPVCYERVPCEDDCSVVVDDEGRRHGNATTCHGCDVLARPCSTPPVSEPMREGGVYRSDEDSMLYEVTEIGGGYATLRTLPTWPNRWKHVELESDGTPCRFVSKRPMADGPVVRATVWEPVRKET